MIWLRPFILFSLVGLAAVCTALLCILVAFVMGAWSIPIIVVLFAAFIASVVALLDWLD